MPIKKSVVTLVPCIVLACLAQGFFVSTSQAQDHSYYPYVIARGADRDIIRNLPIEQRPQRPMHFYGNTVRRGVNRTTVAPQQLGTSIFGQRILFRRR
jgi:hypothetical protein